MELSRRVEKQQKEKTGCRQTVRKQHCDQDSKRWSKGRTHRVS
jgi:hypothetical protein